MSAVGRKAFHENYRRRAVLRGFERAGLHFVQPLRTSGEKEGEVRGGEWDRAGTGFVGYASFKVLGAGGAEGYFLVQERSAD